MRTRCHRVGEPDPQRQATGRHENIRRRHHHPTSSVAGPKWCPPGDLKTASPPSHDRPGCACPDAVPLPTSRPMTRSTLYSMPSTYNNFSASARDVAG